MSQICDELKNYLVIKYDDIVNNTEKTVLKILNYIGVENSQIKIQSRFEPMPVRPEKTEIKKIILRDCIKVI